MYWSNLENKKIGIWGMGREGKAAKEALKRHVQHFTLFEISEENLRELLKCDVVIKSPGVSLYRNEVQQALQKGVQFTSGTNLYFSNKCKNTFTIAITGTKGKSTTSSLLTHTLKILGKKTELGGNIGRPLLDFADAENDYTVAELSSYQCADFMGRPNLGVLINLYPEHLQWHGSHDQYYKDKVHMITNATQKVVNQRNALSCAYLKGLNPIYFNHQAGIHLDDGFFYDGKTKLFPISSLSLIGEHNAENACAVLTVIKLLGLPLQKCAEAFSSFKALPHRLQILGRRDGIEYVDDSISTTPETAIAALKALDHGQYITLIAGGLDRGQDYTELVTYMASYKERIKLVTLPDTGKRLADMAQKAGIETAITSEMPTAVDVAKHMTANGGTILLSPAAPSYNLYQNFEERGDDFKKWALR